MLKRLDLYCLAQFFYKKAAMKNVTDMENLSLLITSNGTIALYNARELRTQLRFCYDRGMKATNSVKFAFTNSIIAAMELGNYNENTLQVTHVWSSERGYGSFLYEIALSVFEKWLTPDEKTSDAAAKIWEQYKQRADIVTKEDPLRIHAGEGFSKINVGSLIARHEDNLEKLLTMKPFSELMEEAGLKSKSDIEQEIRKQSFALLVHAVG